MSVSDIERSERISPRVITNNYPYTSSIASSATSSSSSVFSTDNHSSQSSAPSSSKSALHAGWESEHSDSLAVTDYQVAPVGTTSQNVSQHVATGARVTERAVAPELRQHPRRTSVQVDAVNGCALARPPPSLVRQCDRKDNFVEGLVGKLISRTHPLTPGLCVTTLEDTTTQMIEVIWPLSVIPCGRDAVLGGKNLIGLRTFIQEVLKRSKTSYSTLQVALYYLILIKPHIPTTNFCMEQSEDSHTARAMQCGRRMFLASLILASKYLQDRNYSARAWSKISGLKITEINSNEMAFVTAIDWRLHVSEPLFQRWTDVVLKFNPPASPSSPTFANGGSPWRSVIPKLTPQLDNLDGFDVTRPSFRDTTSPAIGHPLSSKCGKLSMSPPPVQFPRRSSSCSTSNQATPTPSNLKPMAMEPAVRDFTENRPRFPPISPKIAMLPTPQLTPQSANFNTPAVSASGFCPAKSAMSYAWKQVQRNCLARTTLDTWQSITYPDSWKVYPMPSRSSSLVRTASSISSPESMVSDVSARSSRSSSISSVASTTCAPPQPSLAVQATRRCANMQLSCIKENGPAVMRFSPEMNPTWEGRLTSSPLSYIVGPKESYVRDCKAGPQPRLSVPEFSDHDAAEGLRDLALSRHARTLPPLITPTTVPRKRERPNSISDSTLQESVRGLLQPHSLNIENCPVNDVNGEDGTVLTDTKIADSFTLRPNFTLPQLSTLSNVRDPGGNARKRACYMEHHVGGMGLGSEGLAMAMPATGPGMWTGVL